MKLSLNSTLSFVLQHPFNAGRPVSAIASYVGWQIGSRLIAEHTYHWVGGTKLIVRNGMTGATGNIYCGLHEFIDMSFVLHFLRSGDTFLDIGANIGSYTVLAAGACGANAMAFEPDPATNVHLRRNIEVNQLADLVSVHEVALGAQSGSVRFSTGRDTTNAVLAGEEQGGQIVPMRRLDEFSLETTVTMIKLDVEGYEANVLAGARDVLRSPSLKVVATEGQEAEVTRLLQGAGFLERCYDPKRRQLVEQSPGETRGSNALFVRDDDFVRARLADSPRRKFRGREV